MIFDCFLYNGEEDVLDIRMGELERLGVQHIAIEGNRTLQGDMKSVDALFGPNLQHVIVDMRIDGCDCGCADATRFSDNEAWIREAHQRNAVLNVLDAKPDDIVLFGDVDEIPRATDLEALAMAAPTSQMLPVRFLMDAYVFCLDWYGGKDIPATVACRARQISTPAMMRHAHMEVLRGGWHLTYMGGEDVVRRKLRSFSHAELNVPDVLDWLGEAMSKGVVPWNGVQLTSMDGVGHLPRYVRENVDKFSHLFHNHGGVV